MVQNALLSTARRALKSADLSCIGTVREDRAFDVAAMLPATRPIVMRCVGRPRPKDYSALETMMSEGPFVWSAVIFRNGDFSNEHNAVECFHENDFDRLVARLRELRDAVK